MKILFLLSSMHGGGAERVAATLANAWTSRGDDVVLMPTYSGRGECVYEVSGSVRMVWLADQRGAGSGPLRGLRRLCALRRFIRREKPDVIVSFLTNVNVAAVLASLGSRIPVIVCERTHPAAGHNVSPTLARVRRWCYPRASAVTVQTEAAADWMRQNLPACRRLAVMPNPLPEALLRRSLPLHPETREEPAPVLMAMGRLTRAKRFDLLIDCFAQLALRYPAWRLRIWGEGPLRPALQEQIDSLGMGSRVELAGRTSQPWDALAEGDAFVLSSEVEGFPNALLEAMALGLPCVTVDCPSGPAEMTRQGEDALLVPPGDSQALEAALARVMADASLRETLGLQGARQVRERYSLEAVLARWDALFAELGVVAAA
ncbi:glycosyltransferase family 4 protein [Kerstersia sp.]|uniref:glycosyltransferase family 4 protein n=1 Tax=Kerstersia sp. TaxID=1930783 RepID=UPI003F8E8972